MNREAILGRVGASGFWRDLSILDSVGSTNDVAKELASRNAPEGTVVAALEQTKGRGRQDRSWVSEPGKNLTFSIILRPKVTAGSLGLIPLCVAVAVARAVSAVSGKRAGCKWPNDVLVGGKKISGILCESSISGSTPSSVVAGIGVNVNQRSFPPDIAPTATSIALETGREAELADVLCRVLSEFEAAYRPGDPVWPASVVSGWTAVSVILGSRVEAMRGAVRVSGTARGVTPEGALVVDTSDGPVELAAGDVHLV